MIETTKELILELLVLDPWYQNCLPMALRLQALGKCGEVFYSHLLDRFQVSVVQASCDADTLIRMGFSTRAHRNKMVIYDLSFSSECVHVQWFFALKSRMEYRNEYFGLNDFDGLVKFLDKAIRTPPDQMPFR